MNNNRQNCNRNGQFQRNFGYNYRPDNFNNQWNRGAGNFRGSYNNGFNGRQNYRPYNRNYNNVGFRNQNEYRRPMNLMQDGRQRTDQGQGNNQGNNNNYRGQNKGGARFPVNLIVADKEKGKNYNKSKNTQESNIEENEGALNWDWGQ